MALAVSQLPGGAEGVSCTLGKTGWIRARPLPAGDRPETSPGWCARRRPLPSSVPGLKGRSPVDNEAFCAWPLKGERHTTASPKKAGKGPAVTPGFP